MKAIPFTLVSVVIASTSFADTSVDCKYFEKNFLPRMERTFEYYKRDLSQNFNLIESRKGESLTSTIYTITPGQIRTLNYEILSRIQDLYQDQPNFVDASGRASQSVGPVMKKYFPSQNYTYGSNAYPADSYNPSLYSKALILGRTNPKQTRFGKKKEPRFINHSFFVNTYPTDKENEKLAVVCQWSDPTYTHCGRAKITRGKVSSIQMESFNAGYYTIDTWGSLGSGAQSREGLIYRTREGISGNGRSLPDYLSLGGLILQPVSKSKLTFKEFAQKHKWIGEFGSEEFTARKLLMSCL